jgi:hypothetical protein
MPCMQLTINCIKALVQPVHAELLVCMLNERSIGSLASAGAGFNHEHVLYCNASYRRVALAY